MLKLFKRNPVTNALVGVCSMTDGVATALVRWEEGRAPTLKLCAFQDIAGVEEQGATLRKLVKAHDLGNTRCTGILDMDAYNLLLVEAPDVPLDELKAAMRWRVKDLIDYHIDEAVIDVFDIPQQKTTGNAHMMYAVVAYSAAIKQRTDQLLGAGFKLSCVDIPELAMRNLAALLPEDVGGLALIYMARDRGLITLTRQSTLYLSRRIDSGTAAIFGSKEIAALTPEMEGWLDGIVIEVQRSLDYYESHFSQPPVSGAVLAPLACPIAGVAEYLSRQLGIPVRILDLNDVIDTGEPLSCELQSRCLPAVGAALRTEEVAS